MHCEESHVIAPSFEREILDELSRLSGEDTRRVLDFARSLSQTPPRGEPPAHLREIVGVIPGDDLAEMRRAIEDGCERIDPNGW